MLTILLLPVCPPCRSCGAVEGHLHSVYEWKVWRSIQTEDGQVWSDLWLLPVRNTSWQNPRFYIAIQSVRHLGLCYKTCLWMQCVSSKQWIIHILVDWSKGIHNYSGFFSINYLTKSPSTPLLHRITGCTAVYVYVLYSPGFNWYSFENTLELKCWSAQYYNITMYITVHNTSRYLWLKYTEDYVV